MDFKGKVSAVVSQLDLPITVYAATGRDEYRKPRVGMWRELLDDHDLDIMETVDLEKSFFVGDAGGREAVTGITVKDHSCVDRYAAASEACNKGVRSAKDTLGILLPISGSHSIRQTSTSWNSRLSHLRGALIQPPT